MVSLDSISEVEKIFNLLKDGGVVIMEPQKTFWSDCFASVRDKFGVNWLLSYENETQKTQVYGE
jgi:PhnB protein